MDGEGVEGDGRGVGVGVAGGSVKREVTDGVHTYA